MTGYYIEGAGGGKGGGSARTPVETPDSLHSTAYARVIDLISEGPVRGLVNGYQSVYLDGTPLQTSDGSYSFQNVQIETRPGTQDQSYIPGFPSVENENIVGVELRSDGPVVRTVSGSDLSAVRVRLSVPALQKTNTSNGDVTGYSIRYAIDVATDGGAYTTVISNAFTGKTTTKYERSHRIDLPAGSQWQIRIRRLTANANLATIADITRVESITEIIDAKLRYPNSAIAALMVDASQFQSVPERAYYMDGRIIKVPSNYDPDTRGYTGIWDGTFKAAWTNNPAWIFYDIVTNDRFGLGDILPEGYVDRWRLYGIARYCDELVDDGMGGLEPRFVCNVYLQTRADAFKVLQDLASVFRGISFYAAGQVIASADAPSDPVYLYNQGNVVEGRFKYAGSPRDQRHTTALVSWSDPEDFGRQKVEPVEWRPGIARYGINQIEVTAVGCTSRGQAQRVGNHILITENLETETVEFSVGLDAIRVMPGDIFQVSDPNRAGRRTGGRVSMASGNNITLDAVPEGIQIGDTLKVMLSTLTMEGRPVQAINGRVVTVSAPFSAPLAKHCVWAYESTNLALQTFRCLSVLDNEDGTYTINALKSVQQKFDFIDNGTKIELPPISIIPPSVLAPPTNVTLSSVVVIDQGIARNDMTIEWLPSDKAIAYDVEWRRDDMDWVKAGRVGPTSIVIRNVYAGEYLARVRAVNALNIVSIPALSELTQIQGKVTPPPSLTSLTTESIVFGINLKWGFPQDATDTQRTEIWYSPANNLAGSIKLGDFAYPQNSHSILGLAAGVRFFFWGRLVDKSGNIGPWYPLTNGVAGESSSDADEILEYIKGKITRTELGGQLLSDIEGISPDMAGSAILLAGDNTRYAGVFSQLYATQDGDMALAKRVDTVVARVDDANALIQTEITTRVEQGVAFAQQINTTQAQVADTQALVQQNTQTVVDLNGRISATYTLKAQVTSGGQIYAAGFGLGVEQQPDGTYQSQILFQADRFALLSMANGQSYIPFAVENGQVFIQQAFIKDGSITNAKIGNVIESSALGAGNQPRWRLSKDGGLTMAGVANGGGYMTLTDKALRFLNPAGTIALVEIGDI